MKRNLITSLILLSFSLFIFIPQAFAAGLPDNAQPIKTQSAQNYTDVSYYDPNNPTTILHLWESHNPRLADSTGSFDSPYHVYDNGPSYTIVSGQGTYVYDKNICDIKFYKPTLSPSSANDLVNSVSFTIQQTDNPNATSYQSSSINSASCVTDKTDDGNVLTITGTRTNSEGSFVTTYQMKSDQPMEYKADILPSGNSTHYYVITESQDGIPSDVSVTLQNGTRLTGNYNTEKLITGLVNQTSGFIYDNNGFYDLQSAVQYLHKSAYIVNSDGTQHIYNDFMSNGTMTQGDVFTIDPTFGYNNAIWKQSINTNNVSSQTSCDSSHYASFSAQNTTNYGWVTIQSSFSGYCLVTVGKFDISSIPLGSIINSTTLKYDVNAVVSPHNCDYVQVLSDWVTGSNITKYNDVANSPTTYVSNSAACTTTGTGKTLALGSTANTDVKNQLSVGYFSVGLKANPFARDASASRSVTFTNTQLQIVYTYTPTAPILSKANSLSTTSINATWNNPFSATWFLVFRESPTGGGFSQIANTTNQFYVNTGLTHGTQYNYKIFAGNQNGYNATAPSNQISNYTITDPATSLLANTVSTSQIHLQWTVPSGTVTGYKIERESPTGGGFGVIVANTGNSTNHYDNTGLTAGTQYNYRISAINQGGTSAVSNTSSNYTLTNSPTSLKVNTVSTSRINLSWSAPSGTLTGYTIQRESPTGGGFSILVANTGNTTTAYANTGLTSGTQYNYKVAALNQGGTSAFSPAVANYTLNVAPTGLSISQITSSGARVSWINPTGNFSGFKVEKSLNNSTWSTVVSNTNNSTNRYDLTGLSNGVIYYTRISTNYDSTITSPSSVARFLTLNNPPTGVTGTTQPGSQILVSWVAPTGAISGYRIDVSVNGGGFVTLVTNTTTTSTSYLHTGTINSDTYSYIIYTYDNTGISIPSSASSPVTAGDVPSLIFAPSILFNNTSPAIINWITPNANGYPIRGYRIDVSINSSPFMIAVSNTTNTLTTYTYSPMLPHSIYTWRVEALNSLGTGPLGTPSGPVTTGDAPATGVSSSSVKASFMNLNTTSINLHMSSVPRNSSSFDTFTLNQDNWLWLKFDNTTTDSGPLGIGTGTVTGVTTYLPGQYNQAFSFNNATKISYGNNLNFDASTPMSFSGWVYLSSLNQRQEIISKDSTSNTLGYDFRISTINHPIFDLINTLTTNEIRVTSSFTLTTNTWYYIEVSYDGSKSANGVQFDVNGVDDNAETININTLSSSISNSNNLMIGANGDGTNPINGKVDNVKIYPYFLSSSQAKADYTSISPISSGKQYMSWYHGVSGSSTLTKKFGFGSTTSLLCNLGSGFAQNIVSNLTSIYYHCIPSNIEVKKFDILRNTNSHVYTSAFAGGVNQELLFIGIKHIFSAIGSNCCNLNLNSEKGNVTQGGSTANWVATNQQINVASVPSTVIKFTDNSTTVRTLSSVASLCNINFSPTNTTKALDSVACDPSVPAMTVRYWNGMMIQRIGNYNTNSTQKFLNSIDTSGYKKLLSLPCPILVNESPCITFIMSDFSGTDTFVVLTSTHVYYTDAPTALFLLNNNNYGFQSYDIITQTTDSTYQIQNPILQGIKLYGLNTNLTLNKAGLFTLPSGYTTKTTSIESAIRTIDPRWTNDATDIPIITSSGSLFPIVLTVSNAPQFSAIKVTNPLQVINTYESVWAVAQLDSTNTVEFDIPSGTCVNIYIADISTEPSIWNPQGNVCATGTSVKSIVYTNALPLTFFSLPLGATHTYTSTSNILTTTVRSNTIPYTYTILVKNSTGSIAINQTFTSGNALDQQSFNVTGVTKPAILSIQSGGNQIYSAYLGSPLSLASIASFFHTYLNYQGFDLLSFIPLIFAAMFTRNTVGIGAAMVVVMIATLSFLSVVVIPDQYIMIMVAIAAIGMIGYRGIQVYG